MLAAVNGDADRPFLAQGVSRVRGVERGHAAATWGICLPSAQAFAESGLTS